MQLGATVDEAQVVVLDAGVVARAGGGDVPDRQLVLDADVVPALRGGRGRVRRQVITPVTQGTCRQVIRGRDDTARVTTLNTKYHVAFDERV